MRNLEGSYRARGAMIAFLAEHIDGRRPGAGGIACEFERPVRRTGRSAYGQAWAKNYGSLRVDSQVRTAVPNGSTASRTGRAPGPGRARGCGRPAAGAGDSAPAGRRTAHGRAGDAGLEHQRPEPAGLRAGLRRR